MKTIVVKTQAELDALPPRFDEHTIIEIHCDPGRWLSVVARENSSVVARENSSVVALGNASVEARENASVVALENASVVALENASVVARENASVEAWGNSSVVARENASVEAWENASVVARENSSVVALENASVEARGNASVEAWGNSCIRVQSNGSRVSLFAFAVAYLLAAGAKAVKSAKTATIIKPLIANGLTAWLERNAVKDSKTVVLYKRVSKDWKTQEGTANETVWTIGKTLEHPAWDPGKSECGPGKYHACSRPYFCDEFRSIRGDRYVAIEIARKDLHSWDGGDYPHKIAFRAGKVLHEVNRFGKKIEAAV